MINSSACTFVNGKLLVTEVSSLPSDYVNKDGIAFNPIDGSMYTATSGTPSYIQGIPVTNYGAPITTTSAATSFVGPQGINSNKIVVIEDAPVVFVNGFGFTQAGALSVEYV